MRLLNRRFVLLQEDRFSVKSAWVQPLKFIALLVFAIHFLACSLELISNAAIVEERSRSIFMWSLKNYDTKIIFFSEWSCNLNNTACETCLASVILYMLLLISWKDLYLQNGRQADAGTKYLSALYWSCMTITTVGYGDLVPRNTFEIWTASISMFLVHIVYLFSQLTILVLNNMRWKMYCNITFNFVFNRVHVFMPMWWVALFLLLVNPILHEMKVNALSKICMTSWT